MTKRTSIATLFLLTGLFASRLQAGLDPTKSVGQYIHDVWQTDNGLPQNSAVALAQTWDGYLWIGTEIGLARFDGTRFTLFDKRNTPQILADEVLALLVDRDGVLWAGTHGGGLIRYKDGVFSNYTTKTGLSSDVIQTLYQDENGDIWVGTDGGGLVRYHSGHFRSYTRRDGLPDDAVFSICGDRGRGLWIGTHAGLSHWVNGKVSTTLTVADGLPLGTFERYMRTPAAPYGSARMAAAWPGSRTAWSTSIRHTMASRAIPFGRSIRIRAELSGLGPGAAA